MIPIEKILMYTRKNSRRLNPTQRITGNQEITIVGEIKFQKKEPPVGYPITSSHPRGNIHTININNS